VTCTEFLAILDDVIDESIAAQTRAEIENHLKGCGHCEVVLNTVRKTIEIYQCHELYELPTDVSSRLHAAIKSRCTKVR
jgi:predicted anti-sigma-YlaC factor YlaD